MWDWVDNYEAYLFDFDGLLVDTEPLHFKAFKNLCHSHGMEINWSLEEYCKIAHEGGTSLADHICALYPSVKDKFSNWLEFYVQKEPFFIHELENSKIPLMEGAEALLNELDLKKKKMCVVTHSKRDWTSIIRGRVSSLNKIPHWITREDYTEPKPSPEGFQKGIDLIGDSSDRMIGFEDAPRGIRALQETKAKRVLIQKVPNLSNDFFKDPDFYFCKSFEDVGKALLKKS